MTKLIITTCVILFLATGLQASPTNSLSVSLDSKRITFTTSPILKDGVWLVPLETLCKQLGLKVESPDGADMVVICRDGESELCVPLQFGKDAYDKDGITYAKLEDITVPFGYEIYRMSETELEIVRPEQLAPKFTLPDLDGKARHLEDFRGKKTLLYIWGSW